MSLTRSDTASLGCFHQILFVIVGNTASAGVLEAAGGGQDPVPQLRIFPKEAGWSLQEGVSGWGL